MSRGVSGKILQGALERVAWNWWHESASDGFARAWLQVGHGKNNAPTTPIETLRTDSETVLAYVARNWRIRPRGYLAC